MGKEDDKREGKFAIAAALLVLISAMIEPLFSAVLAIGAMVLYALYKFNQ